MYAFLAICKVDKPLARKLLMRDIIRTDTLDYSCSCMYGMGSSFGIELWNTYWINGDEDGLIFSSEKQEQYKAMVAEILESDRYVQSPEFAMEFHIMIRMDDFLEHAGRKNLDRWLKVYLRKEKRSATRTARESRKIERRRERGTSRSPE